MQKKMYKKIAMVSAFAITAVIAVVIVICVVFQSSVKANNLESQDTFSMGLETTVFTNQSLSFDNWLKADFSPDDTYQLKFYKGGKSNNLIINSGAWATESNESGNKEILHLIPDYIASDGYDKVTVTPILGDGFYDVSRFVLLNDVGKSQQEDCNVIDFEIRQLEIEIDEEDYDKIEKKRNEAIQVGILLTEDSDNVQANIKAEGTKYKADLRLKGDWTDHLIGDQWSFRIDLKGDYCIYGLQKFSIQPPQTRNYIWEYLIYEMYREQGGVALRYDFADVFVNDVYKGVYAIEEFMEKRVIEHSQKREGPIIRMSEDFLWEHWANYIGDKSFAYYQDDNVNTFSEKKTTQSSNLTGYAMYAITQLNKLRSGEASVSEVFDINLYARLNAILDIFSASHGRIWHNMRNYYNPVTGLMEPIPFDEHAFSDTHVLADKTNYADYFGFSDSGEYKDLYKKYVMQLAKEYPEFIERHQTQINQYMTTIKRFNMDFYMDVNDVNYRVGRLENMIDVVDKPRFTLLYDNETGRYKLSITNNNLLGLYITDVLNPSGESDTLLAYYFDINDAPKKIEGDSVFEIVLPKYFNTEKLPGMKIVYHTVFSGELEANILCEVEE